MGGEPTVIILCVSYNWDSTIAQGEEQALGLQGSKRIENIQLGLARAEDIQKQYKKVNIFV